MGDLSLAYSRTRSAIGARLRERTLIGHDLRNVRVLTYHGVVESKADAFLERNFHTIDQFREHVRLLKRHHVVSPEEVLEVPKTRTCPVAITFDDGYRNNELAAEVLDAARLPWGLFVSTDLIGSASTIWTAALGLLILRGRSTSLEFDRALCRLGPSTERVEAFQYMRRRMKKLDQTSRQQRMREVIGQFPDDELARLLEEFPSFQMLSWEELGSLSSRCVVGSHGASHEIHHDEQPSHVIRDELARSKRRIENDLGAPCRLFAYPNGDHTFRAEQEVAAAGYHLAFTTDIGTVTSASNQFALPRLPARGSATDFRRALLVGDVQ